MKDPAFMFYPQDWLTGTITMSFEDRGKYITILSVMHQKGRMKEETIRFIVGSVSDSLLEKFKVDDAGLLYNERLEHEIEKRAQFVESRVLNGKKGGRPKAKPNLKETIRLDVAKPTNKLLEDEYESGIDNGIHVKKGVPKIETVFTAPSVDEVAACFKSFLNIMGYADDAFGDPKELAEGFIGHYSSQGWKRTNGMAVVQWQPLVRQWVANEKSRAASGKGKGTNQQHARSWE